MHNYVNVTSSCKESGSAVPSITVNKCSPSTSHTCCYYGQENCPPSTQLVSKVTKHKGADKHSNHVNAVNQSNLEAGILNLY